MANDKGPTEGGSGGRRGHSNMEHWTYTEEIKARSKTKRRQDDRRVAEEGIEKSRRYPGR
jgi:hypothetical protein